MTVVRSLVAGTAGRRRAVESDVGGAFSSLMGSVEIGAWESVAGAGAAWASPRCFSCSVERGGCQQGALSACVDHNRNRQRTSSGRSCL